MHRLCWLPCTWQRNWWQLGRGLVMKGWCYTKADNGHVWSPCMYYGLWRPHESNKATENNISHLCSYASFPQAYVYPTSTLINMETLWCTGRSIHPKILQKKTAKKQLFWNACDELLSESQVKTNGLNSKKGGAFALPIICGVTSSLQKYLSLWGNSKHQKLIQNENGSIPGRALRKSIRHQLPA